MNNLTWLLRAVRWVRNPPSERQVLLVFGVIAICLSLFALEYFDLLPDWASMDRPRGRHFN